MPATKLIAALQSVGWDDNVAAFIADANNVERVAQCNLRIATWAKQFESVEGANPAICFVRELQLAGNHVAALMALGLYRASAASMRAAVEAALYYTFFRTHPSELASLVSVESYFVTKGEILDYHKIHSRKFTSAEKELGLLSRLSKWYAHISSVIHGQVPGTWLKETSISGVKYSKDTARLATDAFTDAESIIHNLFLATVGRELWDGFTPKAKQALLVGCPSKTQTMLGLDGG